MLENARHAPENLRLVNRILTAVVEEGLDPLAEELAAADVLSKLFHLRNFKECLIREGYAGDSYDVGIGQMMIADFKETLIQIVRMHVQGARSFLNDPAVTTECQEELLAIAGALLALSHIVADVVTVTPEIAA